MILLIFVLIAWHALMCYLAFITFKRAWLKELDYTKHDRKAFILMSLFGLASFIAAVICFLMSGSTSDDSEILEKKKS